jgi:hypothetical protein
MARRLRSARIENRTHRLRLLPRRKPYFDGVAPGIAVGYRRNKTGAGTWVVKASTGRGGHWTKAFGIADDHEAANGGTVLDFWQAQDRARALARGGESTSDRPITVSEALDNYAAELHSRRGDGGNVTRVRYHLPPSLANTAVALLTARDLRRWRDGLLEKGLAPASASRTARILKAALSLSAREDARIGNIGAWRDGLRSLPDAEIARNDILSDSDVRALVAAAYALAPAYGLWVETHAVTGARTSQLERLEVRDLQDAGTNPRVIMPSSKKGSVATSIANPSPSRSLWQKHCVGPPPIELPTRRC